MRSAVEKRREYERLLNKEKRDQYSLFLDVLNGFLPLKDGEGEQQISLSDLRKWSLKLMLVGSDDVVRAWNRARIGSTDGKAVMRSYARLFLAMRRDSGHHNTKLTPADMLDSFVNDLDAEHIASS